MTRIDAIASMRHSAMDALITLHDRLCGRPLTVQQMAELQAWAALHKAACIELDMLRSAGVISALQLDPAEHEGPAS